MTEALIGLAGILIGLLLNEHYRRSNRIENYSSRVFERRLEIYEELIRLIDEKASIHFEVLAKNELSKDNALNICRNAGLKVMEFLDSNQLYLNEEIIVHIGATFVGFTEIIESDDDKFKEIETLRFKTLIGNAKKMIKAESGIEELNELFNKITKAKHSSPIIQYFRDLKKDKV